MKTAVLTGASSGIGAAITKELLLLDYEIFGFGRSFDSLLQELSAAGLAERLPQLHMISMDLTSTGILASKIREISSLRPVELLINNAGAGYFGLHEELNPAKIHEMVTVNLEVPLLLSQLLLRDLKKTKGQIIQISSITAKKSSPHGCAYGATKTALTAFSASLFDEVRKYGVRITCIHPDMTQSNFYRNADFEAAAGDETCLQPEDIAMAVRSLLQSRSGMVITDLTLQPQKHRLEKKSVQTRPNKEQH